MLFDRRVLAKTAAVIVGSLLYLTLFYDFPIPDADEGLIAAGAERVLHGQVPFRDFFSELGPVSFYTQALIFYLAGLNVEALRLTAWAVGGALSGLTYLIARQVMSGIDAYLPSIIFTLVCYPHAYRVSHHWWGNVFMLMAVLCLASMTVQSAPQLPARRKVLLGVAGGLSGVALLAMQSKGVWCVLTGVVFLVLLPRLTPEGRERKVVPRGWHLAGWYLLGVVVVAAVAGCFFAVRGALGAWWEDNFHFLLANYRPYTNVPQASAWEMMIRYGQLAIVERSVRFSVFFAEYLFFFLLGPIAAFGVAAWRLLARREGSGAAMLLLLLLSGLGGVFSEYHSPDPIHLMYTTPLMVILLVLNWSSLVMKNPSLRRLGIAVSALAVVLMLFAAGRRVVRISHFDQSVKTRRGIVYFEASSARDAQAMIDAIQQRVPPGGTTFIYPYRPELFFLTATQNPTRFDVLLPDFHSASQIEEVIARLKSARPEYIFSFDKIQRWTIRPHFPDDPPDVVGPHPVERALTSPASGYHRTDIIAGMGIFAADQ